MVRATDWRIDRLVQLLTENATVVVSGSKLADELGVRRGNVWSWIEQLRDLGVEVQGYPGEGYRLRRLPDVLLPALLQPALGGGEIGRKIVHFFSTGSTNDQAMRLAEEGAAHGTVVVAEQQTAGRGRFGRAWYSARSSGIYASVILRPPLAPAAAPILTLMAGLAVRHAVAETGGLRPDIRWPNDLLIGGKKAGGILTEMTAELDRIHAVVLGIGLNVNHRELPAGLAEIATSIRIQTGKVSSRVRLLASVLVELERYYQLLLAQGSGAIARAWEDQSSFARGKRVMVKTEAGESRAVTEGLEPNGALRLRFEDGRSVSLTSGEVVEIK